MKKRILSIILVIAVMLTLVPMSVFANPTGVPQITIDSTTLTQDNTTWSWDAATNTLTLKGINMSLSSEAGSYGIYITGNGTNALTTVNVVVTGNNVISGNTGILYSGSSATVNTINFSGTGSLTVSSGQTRSMKLYCTTVNFNSGVYNLSHSSYNNDNIFVIDASQTTCNFNGATVNMQAAPYGSGYFDGFYDGSEECANSNVYINSGSVTINTHASNIVTNNVVINGGTSDFHVGRTDRITISGNGGKTTINGGQVKLTGGLGLEQFQNNALNTLVLTTLTISGISAPTAVSSLTTSPDLGYTYGTTDMKTDANGVIYAYLPTGKTTATVVAGGNTYTGAITSNAGTLTLLSTLTDISLAPVPIAYADRAIAGTKVADLSATGTPTSGLTYSLDGSGANDSLFQIDGSQLQIKSGATLAAQSYTVKLRVTDGTPDNTYTKQITFTANVRPQTYGVSAATNSVNANGITATATFGSSPYEAGATATVTITLSGTAIETGTHTVGLNSTKTGIITPLTTVTKAVTAGANPTDEFLYTFTMPANAVDDLVVTHNFVQAQSTAPTASATTVAKSAATQATVNFTLNSALTGTWKVYDATTGGSIVNDITASAMGTTLSLTHASNIPTGTYYVSVTEAGKTESTRLALTVVTYIAPICAVSATTNAVLVNGVTATATFGATPYVAGAIATVTINLSGTATATGTHTLGLTSTKASAITPPAIITKAVTAGANPTDSFAFTFTMPANAVDDLVVTHNFVQALSTAPTASVTTVSKTAATQAKVDFTLDSALTGTWKVYDATTGGSIVNDITASAVGTTLSLTHASNIPTGTYYISVTEAGKTESTRLALTVGVYVAPANNVGGGSTSSSTPTPVKDDKVEVIFNKDSEKAATAKVEEKDNIKTTVVTLDDTAVKENLDKMDKADPNAENKKVIIPVNNNSDVVVVELTGQTVKDMEEMQAVLEIKTENASYTLSAADINIDDVSSQMGKQVELKDIKVNVRIAKASTSTAAIVADSAKKNSYTVVVKPVDFEISCTSGTKTVSVARFNSYVERTVALPAGIDPGKITTGVVVNSDGTFSHVPTIIVVIDGKYYAKINSLTNSTYTVISNPVTFKDVEKHWAKNYVNEIGSRLIDNGVGDGNFAPDRAITRAEFASMIVKALGLKGANFSDKFSDVKKSDPYYQAIYTAYEYGIITGYSNGKFGAQDLITRQQAMIMISKAMKIVGMDGSISVTEINSQLELFKDGGDVASSSKQATALCIKYGIFGGSKGKLTPKGKLTRAESATVVFKLLKKSSLI